MFVCKPFFGKIFVTLFSGTMRPRKLKLDTYMNSRWMYRVYWIQAAAAYLPLYFFIFFSFYLSPVFIALFSGTVRSTKLKLGTRVDSGWMYGVY